MKRASLQRTDHARSDAVIATQLLVAFVTGNSVAPRPWRCAPSNVTPLDERLVVASVTPGRALRPCLPLTFYYSLSTRASRGWREAATILYGLCGGAPIGPRITSRTSFCRNTARERRRRFAAISMDVDDVSGQTGQRRWHGPIAKSRSQFPRDRPSARRGETCHGLNLASNSRVRRRVDPRRMESMRFVRR